MCLGHGQHNNPFLPPAGQNHGFHQQPEIFEHPDEYSGISMNVSQGGGSSTTFYNSQY